MTPKAALGAMAIACLGLGLLQAGVNPVAPSKKKLELNFWNGWTGPDGRIALLMIRKFNEENPDLHVSMQRMPWDTYYNKLMVACTDGRGPEIFVVHASTLPRMQRAGFLDRVDDLYSGPEGVPKSDFEPYVLNQTVFDEHNVGLPLDIHPQGMYCNMKLLRSAGFDRPPQTKVEFLRAVRALTKDTDGDGLPDQWGFSMSQWQNNYQSLVPQFDGRYLDADGNPTLNSPADVRALEFFEQLAKEKLLPPPENMLGWIGFRQGKVAMVWDGVYMLGDLKRLNDLEYVGAPIPVIGNHPGTMADSHVLCVRTDLTHEQREGAERFIRYFSAHSVEWADAGQVPARLSVRHSAAFGKMQVQSAFAKQIPNMLYPARTPVLFEIALEINLAVEKVIRGRADAQDALDVANKNSQGFIARDRAEQRK